MEPVFRYIFVLLAVIVVIRILLGVSARKTQQNDNQPTEETAENVEVPVLTPSSQSEQRFNSEDHLSVQNSEEIENE